MISADPQKIRFPVVVASAAFLCALVVVCYGGTIKNGFVADDHYIIELNQDKIGVKPVIRMFFESDTLYTTLPSLPYYRPLSRVSYLFDKYLFGTNPAGYHGGSIILHAACTLLLLLTLLRLGCGMFSALIAASLFGIHPINAEAVNFLSARNNLLATFFVLGSFLAWLRADERGSRPLFAFSGFLFFLATLSKETGVMLLPFLLCLKFYDDSLSRSKQAVLTRDFSFIAYHVIFLFVYLLLRAIAIDVSYIRDHIAGFPGRMHQLCFIIPMYCSLLVAPWRLSFHYPNPASFSNSTDLLVVGIALIAALIALIMKRDRITVIGLAWLFLNFLPISNILPIPSAAVADRYFYLPFIGITMLVGQSLARLAWTPRAARTVAVACMIVGLLLGLQTIQRSRDWEDELSLNRSIAAREGSYALGHFDYGYAAYQQGDVQTATREFRTALSLDPHYPRAAWTYYYLGGLSLDAGDRETALRQFRAAVQSDPSNSKAHFALATLLMPSDRQGGLEEYSSFLDTMHLVSLSSVHHLPEVNSILSTSRASRMGGKNHDAIEGEQATGTRWEHLYHFPTGADLFYDRGGVNMRGGRLMVTTKLALDQINKRSYASRFIRYPLQTAQDAYFSYEVICAPHLYKMTLMEFRDPWGNPLSRTYPEKEAEELFEYALPATLMRSLVDAVCARCPEQQQTSVHM